MSARTPDLTDANIAPYSALWIAADVDYQAALNDHVNGIEREPAMETAHSTMVDIRNRILATPSVTLAEQALKLMIFKSGSAANDAEDANYRKDQLAHLIAGDDFEMAAAYSLMLDMIAMTASAPVV